MKGPPRRSLVLATSAFREVIPLAQRADDLGWHRIWTTETPARDAIVRALTIGLATRRIEVATGIAYAFTRAPLALAATSADAAVALDGRFSLGLGAGTRGMRERWYGVTDFDRPAARLAEYAGLLRAAWGAADTLDFDGRFYRSRYDQLDGRRAAVDLWGSGVNATMLAVAARHFDGVAVHPLAAALPYLDAVAGPALERGFSEREGRAQVACWRLVSVAADHDEAADVARRALAFYFSTPSYGTVADRTGWGEVAARIRDRHQADGPRWQDIGRLVPDRMVDDFATVGTAQEVREGWAALEDEYARRGVDEVVFQPAGTGTEHEQVAALAVLVEALAPEGRR